MQPRRLDRLLAALAFAAPLALYLATAAPCVGFDDAAELALCVRDWSVAHPPGFPAYVALGHLWVQLFSWCGSFVAVLQAFSAGLGAGTVLLLFLTAKALLAALAPEHPERARSVAAFLAAMSCGLGTTVWQWANAIEVYALQGFAAALLLFALAQTPRRGAFALAGAAIGLGLANHHLTMVLLLPIALALVLAMRGKAALRDRRWTWTVGTAAAVTMLFYALMLWRARGVYAFEFGNPDTLGRLCRHVGGGFYGEGLFRQDAEVAARTLFLLAVLLRNWCWFALPLLLGLWQLRRRALAYACVLHLAVVIALQAGRTAVANADSYLIPGLVATSLIVAIGLLPLLRRWHALPLAAAALLAQALFDLPACNRAGFDAGDAWIADFTASAPPRSVVLLTRWESRTLYRLYRETADCRRDLVVVTSDVKGTNADCPAFAYPGFIAALQPEYRAYLDAIAAVDPDFVYSDYFRLDNRRLVDSYIAMLRKVVAVAQQQQRPLLFDAATAGFLLQHQVLRQSDVHPCGILLSLGAQPDAPAPQLSGRWWTTPFVLYDLCSAAVLRDYEQVVSQVASYYRVTHDPRQPAVEALRQRLAAVTAFYAADKPFLGWKHRP